MRALYFGCWNTAGHYLFASGGLDARGTPFDMYRGISLDGNYAPRAWKFGMHRGGLCWGAQAGSVTETEARQRILYDSTEYPQGQFLRHVRDGFTLISWWDRTQGDGRGACNSTFLLEGLHDSAEMLEAFALHFPHVRANLIRAGVQLVEVVQP